MHLSFFKSKSAKSAINYLISDHDSNGNLRASEPTIWSDQDPMDVLDYCENFTTRKHNHTSGVLSWEETLTHAEKIQAMKDFEEFAFAGLESGKNYSILWVEHHDHDRTELHFVCAATELESGKQLNIAPPGWEKKYEDWKLLQNLEHGWSRPDIVKNEQTYTQTSKYESEARKDVKQFVSNSIREAISYGVINNREDVKNYIGELGYEVIKVTKSSITYTDNDGNKYRQKGGYFDERHSERLIKEARDNEPRESTPSIEELRVRVSQESAKRAEFYNRKFGIEAVRDCQPTPVESEQARRAIEGFEHSGIESARSDLENDTNLEKFNQEASERNEVHIREIQREHHMDEVVPSSDNPSNVGQLSSSGLHNLRTQSTSVLIKKAGDLYEQFRTSAVSTAKQFSDRVRETLRDFGERTRLFTTEQQAAHKEQSGVSKDSSELSVSSEAFFRETSERGRTSSAEVTARIEEIKVQKERLEAQRRAQREAQRRSIDNSPSPSPSM